MDGKGLLASDRARVIAANLYAIAVLALFVWLLPRSQVTAPLMLIALGVPLIFLLVPRNWLYGMRTPRTMWTTKETWYMQNAITSVAVVATGVIWLIVIAVR